MDSRFNSNTTVVKEKVVRNMRRQQSKAISSSAKEEKEVIKVKIKEDHLKCCYCGGTFSMNVLLDHLKVCSSSHTVNSKRKKSSDNSSAKKVLKHSLAQSVKQVDQEEQLLPPILQREPDYREEKFHKDDHQIMPILTPAVDIYQSKSHVPPVDLTKHINYHSKEKQQNVLSVPIPENRETLWCNTMSVSTDEITESSEPDLESDDIPMLKILEVKSLAPETHNSTFVPSSPKAFATDVDEASAAILPHLHSNGDSNGNVEYYFSQSPSNLEEGEESQDLRMTHLEDLKEYCCPNKNCDETFSSDILLAVHFKVCSLNVKSDSDYINVFELLSEPEDED